MESPPSQGGFFMPGTQRGTRFAKVVFPGWKGLVTGGGDGRAGLRITGHGGKLTPLILAALAVILASPATAGGCDYYCRKNGDSAATSTPAPSTSWAITNTSRQRLGDVYNPGHGRRLQLRDNDRRIIGYIERDGTVTNTSRQPVASIELD